MARLMTSLAERYDVVCLRCCVKWCFNHLSFIVETCPKCGCLDLDELDPRWMSPELYQEARQYPRGEVLRG